MSNFYQKTAIFSLYRREREMHTCLPNQNAKTFDRANKEVGTGGGRLGKRRVGEGRKGREKGEKEGGKREGREKGERDALYLSPPNKHIIRNGPT